MKFSSHGTYIKPNSVTAMALKPSVIRFCKKLADAQAEDKQNQKAGFKIVHARGRTVGCAEMAGDVQESSHHQQHAADDRRRILKQARPRFCARP